MSEVTATYDADDAGDAGEMGDDLGDDILQPVEPASSQLTSPFVCNYLEGAWWAAVGLYASGQMIVTFRHGGVTAVDVHARMRER